jgi:hypothetical protein
MTGEVFPYALHSSVTVPGSMEYLNFCVRHWLQIHKYLTFITAALLAYTNVQEGIHLDVSCLGIAAL